jgi:hypothetical protein
MNTKVNRSWSDYDYILWILFFLGFIGFGIFWSWKEEQDRIAANYAEEKQAKLEAAKREENARFEKEMEKISIKAEFISYRYYEKTLPHNEQSSELFIKLPPYKVKLIDIFCSLKNPEKGKTIKNVAISVFFRAKGYSSDDYTAPNEQIFSEIEVNLRPNTISTLTFTVSQPKDINMVYSGAKLERVIKSDGTVENY